VIFFLFSVDTSSSNPDSGPNSPPSVANAQPSPTAGRNTPIQEVSSLPSFCLSKCVLRKPVRWDNLCPHADKMAV